MERPHISLVVLTLLQLCRAELKDVHQKWYAANLINDGFQPKPITEIFTTQAPFSTANPIIVSTTTNHLTGEVSTTLAPRESVKPSGFSFPSSTESVAPVQQYLPKINKFPHSEQPPVDIHRLTSQANFGLLQHNNLQPQRNVQIQHEQSTYQTLLPNRDVTFTTPFHSSSSSQSIPSQFWHYPPESQSIDPANIYQTSTEVSPRVNEYTQPIITTHGLQSSTIAPIPSRETPQPNLLVTYQDAQTRQQYPSSPGRTTHGEFFSSFSPMTTAIPSTFSTSPSTFSTPPSTFSTYPSTFSSTRQSAPIYTSTSSPSTYSSSATLRPTITTPSTIGSTSKLVNCLSPRSTTTIPIRTLPKNAAINGMFPLNIRVSAPSGSITKVNINPLIQQATTRKPHTTRHTTRRTQKPKKNTYERCLQGCRKNGQTLCAAPLSQTPIDPKTLRGFPSVCHMACHNSYKNYPYEKIVDGSCGKLRTHIRPVDSRTKLKKDELHKVQYTLDNSKPAIVEFVGGTYA